MSNLEHIVNSRNVYRDALNLFIGRGRRYEIKEIAAAINAHPDTLARALNGVSCPDWVNTTALMRVLPIEFAEMMLRPAGITGVRRLDGTTTPAEALSEVAEATAALAAALADGRIDHTERPKVLKEASEAICALSHLVAQLGGGR